MNPSNKATHSPLRRLHRCLLVALTAACLLGLTAGSAAAAGSARVQATQELAVLTNAHAAHQAPDAGSPQVAVVSARRPITGERTTLPVLSRSIGAGGVRWLQVMLPGRPDGLTGWIAQTGTSESVTPWRIIVNLASRRVSAYNDGRLQRSFAAVVGKPSTPTMSTWDAPGQ